MEAGGIEGGEDGGGGEEGEGEERNAGVCPCVLRSVFDGEEVLMPRRRSGIAGRYGGA